ncbi:LysM peptidoglycan-binding domain-containing protein [Geomonas subterranea]|uniref:LysM peptidoglycan-binding domain-containing protein n=1 Tax=Geomonas subterranea TaxID=2847989 RepID=A0ABX8LKD7_9BACT|nr:MULTISPECIES: LysM peptidoglycan-binding domain-containing protein [Geomonas]QXE92495.1 LysM peptidoglycan-binding domain-containing protein [Geomonas subterranea]QXM09406.1 LysM peptidoglycan-binding domain-containing protein [Geomonas subterranea]
MKKHLCLALLFLGLTAAAPFAAAQEQPTIYTIVPGDTLWGLSQRFLKDPYYWPNVWANNQAVGNPHFIYPGQKVRIYSDRIEIEPAPGSAPQPQAPIPQELREEAQPVTFTVNGSEGFLIENGLKPSGTVISLHQNREMAGTDDIVYTDIGRIQGGNPGDRYQIYKKIGPVSHPVTNVILGQQVMPLGELQLSELEEKASKAIVTKSFQEISAGSFLLPYQERKLTITLKSADRDLTGYIVQTQTGNQALAVSDVVFLDLGKSQGVQPGNMLYIVRDVVPDQRYANAKIEKLPVEVVGALVVVATGMNSSTAVIVKSVDTVYRGDRVEMKKSR